MTKKTIRGVVLHAALSDIGSLLVNLAATSAFTGYFAVGQSR